MKISADTIWAAIDNVARANNITCSHMAKLSNLDLTTFNKSKRVSVHGKPHWPSVETIVKMLRAMNLGWVEFADYFPKPTDDNDNDI